MNIPLHPAQCPVQHASYQLTDKSGAVASYVRYRVTTKERKVCEGVSNREGVTQLIPTPYPDEMTIEIPEGVPSPPEKC